jgi:glycosyltransferase involved in cell wall biosynthesis
VVRILAIIPDLTYCGAGKQLVLLAKNLPKDQFEMRVCVIGQAGPLLAPLRDADIAVELLNWHRSVDIRPWLEFRKLLQRFEPQVIHAWQKRAWRFASLANLCSSRPFVMSFAEPNRAPESRIGRLDRWLFTRAVHLVATSKTEADFYFGHGMSAGQVTTVQPAVEIDGLQEPATCPGLDALGLSPAARIIACVGPLEAKKGYLDAIWAFDILKYLYDDLHLVIAGDGPDRERLERFVHSDKSRSDVHLIGHQPEIFSLLARAEVVWVPSRIERGINVTLEAMALARPVVASRLPAIAEIVIDGETGLLFIPGDRAALARQTRRLLDDTAQRQRLGQAGKERASRFAGPSMVGPYSRLYELAADVSS